MKQLLLTLSLLCLTISISQAAHYAVLAAGSSGYSNYRHQADIFHAYNVLLGYGIPAENIITFAYDDIANHRENPFKGQVFNKPSTGPGKDVYANVKIDYREDNVTAENFLAVLKGNSSAVDGNRVLESTEEDNVFIYFADHGATGLIAFPYDYLYADDFLKTLQYMNDNKKYKQMVIYIEACESGSMFENLLPNNISIYATTAANPSESSWAAYCFPGNKVNGKRMHSCLGDLYSINFLESLESSDPSKQTLEEQFEMIKSKTTQSHVQQYGNLNMTTELVGDFEGNSSQNVKGPLVSTYFDEGIFAKDSSLVDSRYAELAYLKERYDRLQTEEAKNDLKTEEKLMKTFDKVFESLSSTLGLVTDMPVGKIDFSCLKARVATFEEMCGKFTDYGLKYVRYLHTSCVLGVTSYEFESALMSECA